jgi:hypothetical protein
MTTRRLFLTLALLAIAATAQAATTKVALKPQPNTPLDTLARNLVAQDLSKAAMSGEKPLLLVAEAPLGGPKDKSAIFIQLQSERECGSAGCNTTVYMQRGKAWVIVLDSVGGAISVDSTRHNGMRDLLVGSDGRWIWNGKTYIDTSHAPDLKIPPKRVTPRN